MALDGTTHYKEIPDYCSSVEKLECLACHEASWIGHEHDLYDISLFVGKNLKRQHANFESVRSSSFHLCNPLSICAIIIYIYIFKCVPVMSKLNVQPPLLQSLVSPDPNI